MLVINAGFVSYAAGAVLFAVLTALLAGPWRGRLGARLFLLTALATSVWATAFALAAGLPRRVPFGLVAAADIVHSCLWLVLVWRLIRGDTLSGSSDHVPPALQRLVTWTIGGILGANLLGYLYRFVGSTADPRPILFILSGFALSVIILVLVEQLYRNSGPDLRWTIKFFCLGVGGKFAYDLYLFATALLFLRPDSDLLDARGAVNALVVPLIAISVARSGRLARQQFVSRRMVFYSTALLAIGFYLMVMAAGGYLVRIYGGSWGAVTQILFLSGALILLAVVLFSGQARARVKVFLSKHFFAYRYDYREEWLKLTRKLSDTTGETPLAQRAIEAVSELVDSPAGALWLMDESRARLMHTWNMAVDPDTEIPADSALCRFLDQREWIVDLRELRDEPDLYDGLAIPPWLTAIEQAWLVVPLKQDDDLVGFVVLARSRAMRDLTWEDHDLLKTVGRQVAGHLALDQSAQLLAETRQFQAYHRLTAFIMHDLKNLIAQQSLVVKNAAKHKDKPEFVDDAIATVDNSVQRMQRLLEQLQRGDSGRGAQTSRLREICQAVVRRSAGRRPEPTLELEDGDLRVSAPEETLTMILGHLVRNAQEATPAEGSVTLIVGREARHAIIRIRDTGEGMSPEFVRDRLFRPFDTTKGSKGMGIGVYQAREFIRSMGGSLDVESRPGAGSTFIARLPLVEEPVATTPPSGVHSDG